MEGIVSPEALVVLWHVLMIDLVLAGDNAIAIGIVAAGLPTEHRRRIIVIGIAAAAVLRIAFASVTVQLLAIPGLVLVGGVLLAWVTVRLAMEIRRGPREHTAGTQGAKSMRAALGQILIADVTMSLDNVLAVASAARGHPVILVIGLAIAVVCMGTAASFIATLLQRHWWIAWMGVGVLAWVCVVMLWEGTWQVATYLNVESQP